MNDEIKIETKVTLKIKDTKITLTIEEARDLVRKIDAVVNRVEYRYWPYNSGVISISNGTGFVSTCATNNSAF